MPINGHLKQKQMTETAQTHPAETYLRDTSKPNSIYVRIEGNKRKLFINKPDGPIEIISLGQKNKGHVFNSWDLIEKTYIPKEQTKDKELEAYRRLTGKYKKLAEKATFTNLFIETVRMADPEKDPYENKITTGTSIDGQCITLETINRWYRKEYGMDLTDRFLKALHERKKFHSGRFNFQGYDGQLWCEPYGNGQISAGFSKEYRGKGNGYYYALINEETVIGIDID